MSAPGKWSLEGDAPEPAYMPTPTPEQAAAIREEVAKVDPVAVTPDDELRAKREAAVKRGMARGEREAKAKATKAETGAGPSANTK